MAGTEVTKPFAWSYSALEQFENCPKQYYHLRVLKDIKEEKSEHMTYGNEVHLALFERVVNGKPLPLRFRHLEAMADKLANTSGEKHGELRLALSADFEPREFFDSDVFVRSIIDLLVIRKRRAIILDYKTGKMKDDFTQLKLSAAVLSKFMPELETFDVGYVWLKDRKITQVTLKLDDFSALWADLLSRVRGIQAALSTTSFQARPSPLCKWCPVASCPHHSSK
jgi:RecB family exonuclease